MNIENFIENFSALLPKNTELSGSTVFKELPEWSSLVALSVIAMVEDEYDVLLKSNDIVGAKTLQELFDIVSAQQP